MAGFRERVVAMMRDVQDEITAAIELEDGHPFHEDIWAYSGRAGGGRTRVLEHGGLIEKGGVNFSEIEGDELPAAALAQLDLEGDLPFFATGVSLVLHPHSPHIPTVHMNVRYFEAGPAGEHWWFGGGIDLSPVYPVRDQIIAFHRTLKHTCDRFDPGYYPEFKAACDAYFTLPHRGEMRGVGGIFFDHLQGERDDALAFTEAVGRTFLPAYLPFLEANRDLEWTDDERAFQLLRRGRYVEFNLLWDRGTKFGIQSGGRTESILMSMPAQASWAYDDAPAPDSREAELVRDYLQPRDWADMEPMETGGPK